MAYKWDQNGLIAADGLPNGAKVDVNQYQGLMQQFQANQKQRMSNYMYGSMSPDVRLSDSISKFVYKNGKVQGFIPEIERKKVGYSNEYEDVVARDGGVVNQPGAERGYYIDVGGIVFDDASKSGDVLDGSEVIFSTDQGAPLAEFRNGTRTEGYMRLATQPTQQAKTADKLRLGNESGTTSASIRQNAQRRTLL